MEEKQGGTLRGAQKMEGEECQPANMINYIKKTEEEQSLIKSEDVAMRGGPNNKH